jgi:hypothetical protein
MNKRYIYSNTSANDLVDIYETKYLEEKTLTSINVNNGIIMPYGFNKPVGVFKSNGHYVELSSERNFFNEKMVVSDIEECNEVVFYLGGFHTGHWGNFLIDNISRLWYWLENNERIKIAYCGRSFREGTFGNASSNAFQLLSLLGIGRDDLIDVRTPLQFKKVIVPQKSFIHYKYVSPPYLSIYHKLREVVKCKKEVYNKIYFTRRQLTRRKEIGEDIFEKLFKKNGYKILAPETLTFEEQAYLIYNCKTLASIEGTLAHNIVFAKKETQQIILRKQSEVIPRQIMLNQVTSTDVIYVDVYKEPFKSFPISHDRGPFLLVWNINIERFIADNKFESISVNVIKQIYNLCIYGMKCLIYSCKHKMKRFWLNKSHVINAYI